MQRIPVAFEHRGVATVPLRTLTGRAVDLGVWPCGIDWIHGWGTSEPVPLDVREAVESEDPPLSGSNCFRDGSIQWESFVDGAPDLLGVGGEIQWPRVERGEGVLDGVDDGGRSGD